MNTQVKAVFLDAAGTLFTLAEAVGRTYQRICAAHGIIGSEADFEAGFRKAWKLHAPPFHPPRERSADDDKSWWRMLFLSAVLHAAPEAKDEQALNETFEQVYGFYGTGAAWMLYPEVKQCLEQLAARCPLWVLSNFDRRLLSVLADLGIRHFFQDVILSSEVGASKPHARMFETGVTASGVTAAECLHIGDEEKADGEGARASGLQVLLLNRPEITLEAAVTKLAE